jgi:hypothetical protein
LTVRSDGTSAALVLALGVSLCAPGLGRAVEPAPLPWRESTPTARMFLQLPFEAPAVVGERDFAADLRLCYSNSILAGATSALAVDVDSESAAFTALLRYGFAPGFEAQLAVPVFLDYGGFLDGSIDAVERFFGSSSMPHRRDRANDQARFQITRPDGARVRSDGPGAGLGDVWTGFKVLASDQHGAWPRLALRGALKLPTGQPPYGSGAFDLGASLLLGWTWRLLGFWLEVDGVIPGGDLKAASVSTHAYGAAQLGLTVSISRLVALNAQWSSHLSPFERTGIPQLDASTHYLLLGASFELSRLLVLEAAAVENVFSPASGVDFAVLLGLRMRPARP